MKTEVSLAFKVPKRAYEFLEMISKQNKTLNFTCMGDNEVLFTADMLDFSRFSDDCGWEEINNYLEEVE